MQYFYLIPEDLFQKHVAPAITSSWQRRNFKEIAELCRGLHANPANRLNENGQPPSVLQLAGESSVFRPDVWRILVAETLLLASAELPEIDTPLESWARLIHQQLADTRPHYSPIQKAVFGGRDLFLGSYYRPENAGWNDCTDVSELNAWLWTLRPESWQPEALMHVPLEDREEELNYAREWLEHFAAMYQRAGQAKFVIICEQI